MNATTPVTSTPTGGVEYAWKGSPFSKEERIRLADSELVLTREGSEQHIPLQSIDDVWLQRYDSRYSRFFHCVIHTRDDRKVTLRHPARVKDGNERYTPFVRALHQALVPYASGVHFHSGKAFIFWGQIVTIVALVGF